MLSFLRTTLVGGLIFLLPIGIVLLVLGKVFEQALVLGHKLHASLFPGSQSLLLPVALAFALLVGIAFLSGLFARTALGSRAFRNLESLILSRVPAYSYMRETLSDLSGSAEFASGHATKMVVEVRYDDVTAIGFVVGHMPDGRAIVFQPNAPTPLSGSVVIVDADRIIPTEMTHRALFIAMKRLGEGLAGAANDRDGAGGGRA